MLFLSEIERIKGFVNPILYTYFPSTNPNGYRSMFVYFSSPIYPECEKHADGQSTHSYKTHTKYSIEVCFRFFFFLSFASVAHRYAMSIRIKNVRCLNIETEMKTQTLFQIT